MISPLQKQSLVTFVLQFDLRGWVPQASKSLIIVVNKVVVNQVTASFPLILLPIANKFNNTDMKRTSIEEPVVSPSKSEGLVRQRSKTMF